MPQEPAAPPGSDAPPAAAPPGSDATPPSTAPAPSPAASSTAAYDTSPPPPDSSPPPSDYSPPPRAPEAPPPHLADVDEPLPPPPPEEHHGFKMPPWSVRIDPFTWLIEGRLGVELEVGVLKWLSVELVPIFVTNTEPPALTGFSGRDSDVSQHSNGPGPISGTSIGAGFWLDGHVLHGYVLRAIFTNYGYTYSSAGNTDQFTHTDRVLEGMFGSNATWGPFTIGGGIGLGVDLNHQVRCAGTNPNCNDLELEMPNGGVSIISSSIYPVVIDGRISLGVTFD